MDALPVGDQPVEDVVPEVAQTNRRFSASPVEGGVALRAVRLGRGRLTLEVPLGSRASYPVLVGVATDTAIGIAVHSAPAARIAGRHWTRSSSTCARCRSRGS
ncbi:hypothetical protein [Pseudonocardia xishanensis]|uniref:Uncharacterized protein n=1 Tax=Pseudonocardia xishanensis TaxID=630995 RepID=A0ABP8RSQ3_9PSEU